MLWKKNDIKKLRIEQDNDIEESGICPVKY